MKRRQWLLALAALPLLCAPFFAGDVAGQEQPAPAEVVVPTRASDADAAEERVSADNNLSFPVDI
ncbi:MAG: hypothetical protein ABW278_07490 [Steroidobacteraceae bacterium]